MQAWAQELIDTLEYSKKTSAVINKATAGSSPLESGVLPCLEAMEEAKVTEVEIDEVRRCGLYERGCWS